MTKDEENGPMQARASLVDIIKRDPHMTEVIVSIIENELRDIQDQEVVSNISNTLTAAASHSGVDSAIRDNVFYWLTETSPDVRQMILVKTIEDLLETPECRDATMEALGRISSKDNVKMVFEWVNSNILTLDQAVFVLLYPDSSDALK